MQPFHAFLVLGMFLTGSLNTIVNKAADQTGWSHPFLQTIFSAFSRGPVEFVQPFVRTPSIRSPMSILRSVRRRDVVPRHLCGVLV
jgi:hypothetical protein